MKGTAIYFQFEADYIGTLRCIPMSIRFKLDAAGLKLKLSQWARLGQEDRRALAETPCDTAEEVDSFRIFLSDLVRESIGESLSNLPAEYDSDWKKESAPVLVLARADKIGVAISQDQWAALLPLQRFALVKLVRPGHGGHNFRRALEEFGLLQGHRCQSL